MQQGEEDAVSRPLKDQLSIDVPPAPGAIGRWTTDDEIAAYRRLVGEQAAERQRKLAEEAGECSCGVQSKEASDAAIEGRRARKVAGHLHSPGCRARRELGNGRVKISEDEQQRRYDAEKGRF
jgi:hypothetical protein